jgi:hypothetical protein
MSRADACDFDTGTGPSANGAFVHAGHSEVAQLNSKLDVSERVTAELQIKLLYW